MEDSLRPPGGETPQVRLSIASLELASGFTFEQYVMRLPRCAMTVVLDDAAERILLIWRHRFILDRWMWELPGGYIDPGEDGIAAAAREVEEETGYRPRSIEPILTFQPMTGLAHSAHEQYHGPSQALDDRRRPSRWQAGRVHAAQFILYVADQARARDFYRHVLVSEPVLDVPGMTEFDLGGATLGLMPAADMETLLSGQIRAGADQRCELYLRRGDAAAALARAVDSGGRLLDGLRDRSWGECAGYLLDPDGHVLALAVAAGPTDEAR